MPMAIDIAAIHNHQGNVRASYCVRTKPKKKSASRLYFTWVMESNLRSAVLIPMALRRRPSSQVAKAITMDRAPMMMLKMPKTVDLSGEARGERRGGARAVGLRILIFVIILEEGWEGGRWG